MDHAASGGPDRGWSWVIAFACCFSSFVLAGIFRTSGVLFVAFISAFGVTREAASWPMAVCISVLNLTGPFSGILGQKYGARPIIITGAIVATIGISSCYLTTSLDVITVLFGGVFGVGYGFMNTLMPGILNAYFLNLRATANGIANSGSCIGSVVLPVVFEYLISTYGLSGCFLLTGGMVLHIAIAASLMRPPPWLSKAKFLSEDKHELQSDSNVTKNQLVVETRKQSLNVNKHFGESNKSIKLESSAFKLQDIPENNVESNGCENSSRATSDVSVHVQQLHEGKGYLKNQKLETSPSDQVNNAKLNSTDHLSEPGRTIPRSGSPYRYETETDPENQRIHALCNSCLSGCECEGNSLLSIMKSFVTVLACPMFHVTAITNVSFYFLFHMYVVIIVDYALDSGVPGDKTKYILVAFSVADLLGRLCFGWVTDRRFVTRPNFVMACMMMIGGVFFLFPFARDYWSLVGVSCCYGLLLGCTTVVFPILLVDFLGIELHAVSYGCMCFMNGFASFGRPFLIGYFRDSLGSYSSMFYVLGILSIVASTLWLLGKVFDKKKNVL